MSKDTIYDALERGVDRFRTEYGMYPALILANSDDYLDAGLYVERFIRVCDPALPKGDLHPYVAFEGVPLERDYTLAPGMLRFVSEDRLYTCYQSVD